MKNMQVRHKKVFVCFFGFDTQKVLIFFLFNLFDL